MHAGEEHGKVPYIDEKFLLVVEPQLGFRDSRPHDDWPGPVVLAVHDGQQALQKLCSRQSLLCHALPSFLLTGYNQPRIT